MATDYVTDSNGEEQKVFECDVCGRIPVLQLLEDHESPEDLFHDDGQMKDKFLRRGIYNILQYDSSRNDKSWEICGTCKQWHERILEGAMAQQFKVKHQKS